MQRLLNIFWIVTRSPLSSKCLALHLLRPMLINCIVTWIPCTLYVLVKMHSIHPRMIESNNILMRLLSFSASYMLFLVQAGVKIFLIRSIIPTISCQLDGCHGTFIATGL